MKFEVTVLGSSSATPVFNRNPSAQVLNCNEKIYLIDCGEGTQQQLIRFNIKSARIDYVFITHLHGDHYFGLIGLLSSMHLNGRIKPLDIFGPAALQEILELQFRHSETVIRYELNFHVVDPDRPGTVFENSDLVVSSFPLNHRIPCTGYRFSQKKRQRKLIKEKVADVPVVYFSALKKGQDVTLPDGRVLPASDYTTAAEEPRSYAYCSDTLCDGTYLEAIRGSNTIYHEATFLHEMLDRANETHHSTALQAAEAALEAGAEKLIIGHYSSRYKTLEALLDEARAVFPQTQLALEGRTYTL
ncbi:ribonuclease Z [Pedobacter yulinensis]|uniref:Ribonuclease Z n=1 Tax=Pedobacter yulinensis TaxID=2126353 RepID=A0A2T3HJS7_9SPHI|nr:ribonuclease Z [Pedobacter yulinensis]PST82643.1 ribonuclease Z [Pedobacter yulinensis]